ncbi:unnamed protein product [Cuscuta campestris]|uniref:Phytocyanin domain-containing protein n=1 Tax=Cuscuta campestris TaxID=132261 RepID=A0A484LKZ3_9ASTE|nr:unnamed protein product [Cuscuta campestris]
MGKMMATKIEFVAFAVFLAAVTVKTSMDKAHAAVHIVGGAAGWTVPSGGASYVAWASNRTFLVGDTLVFNFATGFHDVAKVTKSAYDKCNTTTPNSLLTVAPANIVLNSAGQHYFMCTFSQHCPLGQKLAITVSPTSPSPSIPSPSPKLPPKSAQGPIPKTPQTPTPSSSPSSSLTPTRNPGSSPAPMPHLSPSPKSNPGVSAGPPVVASSPGASPSPKGTTNEVSPPMSPSSAPIRVVTTLFALAIPIIAIGVIC